MTTRLENKIAIRDWLAARMSLDLGHDFVGRAAKHCNIVDQTKNVARICLPTWTAKLSNYVGSSKVGALNPTLFDSLAKKAGQLQLAIV